MIKMEQIEYSTFGVNIEWYFPTRIITYIVEQITHRSQSKHIDINDTVFTCKRMKLKIGPLWFEMFYHRDKLNMQ